MIGYEALPSEPGDSPALYESPYSYAQDIEEEALMRPGYRSVAPLPTYDSDPRFKMVTPSPLTRAALLLLIVFLFWWAVHLRKGLWIASGMGMEKQEIEEVDLSY